MIYITIDEAGNATGFGNDRNLLPSGAEVICRTDFTGLVHAEKLAVQLVDITGRSFIAVDKGACVSPRFDVIVAPAVGDVVSKSFNGDSYPVGKIVRISKTSKKITTEDGQTFYRQRQTGSWSDGTFNLIIGAQSTRNPHL